MRFLFFVLSILLAIEAIGYDSVSVDLSKKWVKNEGGVSEQSSEIRVIHFALEAKDRGVLAITNSSHFSVFLNNQLFIKDKNSLYLNTDSLKGGYIFPLKVSVISNAGLHDLSTQLVSVSNDKQIARRISVSMSAISITSIVLLAVFVLLYRTNPHGLMEYFDIAKVFSIRNLEEGFIMQRIRSFNNVFVYGFCSGLVALNIFVISSPSNMDGPLTQLLGNIITWSVGIFIALIGKIVVTSVLSSVFKLSEFAPGQFYNFVKVLLTGFAISSLILLINFMFGGTSSHWQPYIITFLVCLLIGFIVMIFIKLSYRGGFTVFHLFSYLCATEIFPIVLLLNIFYS